MQKSTNKNLKITYNGETKRVKAVSDYKALVQKTQQAFALDAKKQFKFYYLDEEQEIISVSSQFDLDEAIDDEPVIGCLKLIIAGDASEARSILEQQLQDNASMRDLNASMVSQSAFVMLNSDKSMTESALIAPLSSRQMVSTGTDFEKVTHADMSTGTDFKLDNKAKATHTIGVGSNVITTEQATDVLNLVNKKNMGCDAKVVTTHDQEICTQVDMTDNQTQARQEMRDSSCGGEMVVTNNQGSQMQINQCDQESSCLILVPSDEDVEMNEDIKDEQISCFKCKGSQVNKKGLPCRKCNGTGTVSSHMFGDVLEVVRAQIREMCTHSFREQIKSYLADKKIKQDAVQHKKFICDVCDMNPIKGIRYMCTVRHNYDLCEKCEASQSHPHPLLKIRFPDQAPYKIVCQFKQPQETSAQNQQQPKPKKAQAKAAPKKYLGRFIKESFGDKFVVTSGQTFTKTWTFRNDGKDEWPEDTLFIQTNGDEIGAASQPIDKVVQPNEEYTWTLQLRAPLQAGRYTAYFRMSTENNYRFGHKVWCDIQVVNPPAPAEAEIAQQASMPLEKPQIIQAAPVKELAEKRMNYKESEDQEMKDVSSFQEDFIAQQPLSQAEIEKRAAIAKIRDLGFKTDEKIISALFDKYGKVDIVAAVLAESALSESAFECVSKATNN